MSSVNSRAEKVEYLVNIVNNSVELSEYEKEMIYSAFNSIYKELPTTRILITSRVNEVIQIRSDINYLKVKVSDTYRNTNIKYLSLYNKKFTILTRQGRPSKAAIDSEIYTVDTDIYKLKCDLDALEESTTILEDLSSIVDNLLSNLERRSYALLG